MSAVTEPQTEVQAEAEKTHEERFKWRAWVHHPQGAVACPNATNGKCGDDDHFHAFIRLPNPYQHDDIVEKAQAARARRMRMLKDMESDVRVILESELAMLQGVDKSVIVDELVDRNFTEDYMTAVREVESREVEDYTPDGDEPAPKVYANIDADREEYDRRKNLPEDQRGDDFEELERHYGNYSRDVREALEAVQKPKRDHLTSLDLGELIAMVRRERMEQTATQAYLKEYQRWQTYICTLKGVEKGTPGQRYWTSVDQMTQTADRDVIAAINEAFNHLEAQLARTRPGKDS